MSDFTTVSFPVELPLVRKGQSWRGRAGEHDITLTNLDKVYFPEFGYTKGDVLTYYFNVSPVMLPHLCDRPLTLKRMPNGIHGAFFYEKNAPRHTPKWLKTIPVEAETRKINFLSVRDVPDVLWIANLGCIEFHPLHGKGTDQSHPTYAFFDLDPMEGASWHEVQYVASLVKLVLDQVGIEGYPKTSGATGMQIMVPLDGTHDYTEVRRFVGAVSTMVHEADKEVTSMEWEISKRGPKVYLDVNMNRSGANIAAAYSVRPVPQASVSTPFTWDELEDIKPAQNTIATIFDRLGSKGDPFAPVAQGPGQSLEDALEKLQPVIDAYKITGSVRQVPR